MAPSRRLRLRDSTDDRPPRLCCPPGDLLSTRSYEVHHHDHDLRHGHRRLPRRTSHGGVLPVDDATADRLRQRADTPCLAIFATRSATITGHCSSVSKTTRRRSGLCSAMSGPTTPKPTRSTVGRHHHRCGDDYVSGYATTHPSEDWAETFAHYLHIRATLQTANAFGIRVTGASIPTPALRTPDCQYRGLRLNPRRIAAAVIRP